MNDLKKTEEKVIYSLRDLYHKYGYSQFKISKFEPYDLYMQNKEFLVSGGIITFTDTDGTLMALKPDVTLSIVKNFRKDNTPLQKVCYNENVYRIAGAGRNYREIMQTGLECLGDVGIYEIAEVIILAVKSLRLISDHSVLDLSHMGILSRVIKELELDEKKAAELLHYLGEKNKDAIQYMLGQTKADKLLRLMDISGPISKSLPELRVLIDCEELSQLENLSLALTYAGVSDFVQIDFSIISDLHYYNDFVFRGYVEGIPAAILAGGQYDRLMEKMNKNAGGIGFAVYLDQLELLDERRDTYDLDTVLLYDNNCNLADIVKAANDLSDVGVFLSQETPKNMSYRRLVKLQDGRLTTIEENG